MLLLFGSAFSAYATAEALTSGTIPLTSIQIGSFLNGNVLAGQENVGYALGLGMVVIIAFVMLATCLAAAEGGAMAAVTQAAPASNAGGRHGRPAARLSRSGAGSSLIVAGALLRDPAVRRAASSPA